MLLYNYFTIIIVSMGDFNYVLIKQNKKMWIYLSISKKYEYVLCIIETLYLISLFSIFYIFAKLFIFNIL